MPPAHPKDGLPGDPAHVRPAGPTAARLLLGARLRRLRENAGIDRDTAGEAIRASGAKIRRLENGGSGFKRRDVADLLTLYGVTDAADRAVLMELVGQANAPGWWHEYADLVPSWFEPFLGLEQSARVIRTWELQFVPGLRQTPEYARAVIAHGHPGAPAGEIERRVALRMRRQRILVSPGAAKLWAVIDEGALRRRVGGRATMSRQLAHLVEMAALPNVTVQVMPLDAPHNPSARRPATVLRSAADIVPDVVYCEQLGGGLYFDKPADTSRFWDVLNWLGVNAAPPRETPAILRRLMADLEPVPTGPATSPGGAEGATGR